VQLADSFFFGDDHVVLMIVMGGTSVACVIAVILVNSVLQEKYFNYKDHI